ncbi:hypothetical protein ACERK3_03860 [Phycisphaerales bacterium AB-hyl4]|uniref:Uncharacterized protein n=1 Tax=Natronomicrosphaera hydrolytica TaxID=3242702 RepID=A0ABV4U1K9_9BACT
MLNLSPRAWLRPTLAGAVALTLTLVGCVAPEKPEERERTVITEADNQDDEVTASTQALADRLSEALTQGGGLPEDLELTDEQWEQIRAARQARQQPEPEESEDEPDRSGEAHGPSSAKTVTDIEDEPDPLTRRELLALLRERLRESDNSTMSKALIAAAISLADPNHEIDPAILGQLSGSQRDRVELFQQLLLTLGQELAQGGDLERYDIERRLDELFRDRPLEIRTFALCRRVSGYGVYEPFESKTFLAGRDQRVIAYSELEHFRHNRLANGNYEVELEQEVVLYNESDGLAVWRHEPVRITDESRNPRRDFFVVQMITLPARISVGKYRLKVRISDQHGNSLDETTIPLEFVADASLVRSRNQ